MKSSKLFSFIFIFCLAFVLNWQAEAQSQKQGKAKGNQQVSIKTSAQCEMCKETIEKALRSVKGVKRASVNLDNKNAIVTFNSKLTNVDAVKQAISKAGYDADEVSADQKAYNALPACCKKK